MYTFMINVLRATNKVLYAKLCVINIHTFHILTPELRAVWERYRTASLRGHIGHNFAWDFALERMNLEAATILGSNISPERLPESGDGERLEFFRGERVIDVINSTELRAVGVDVREIGLFPAEAGVNDPDALIKWELSRNDEAEALTWCR